MTTVSDLLAALHADPADHGARLALADALEEAGRAGEAEAARLHARQLMRLGSPEELARLGALLEGGVRPVVPEVVNSVGMRLALIPPGAFLMGSPEGEAGRDDDERQHEVVLTSAYYLGVCPVTQAEYKAVTGRNPSHFQREKGGAALRGMRDTSRFPVESVSWGEAVELCGKLTEKERKEGVIGADQEYRLPSAAEWERACRGGAASYQVFHTGDSLSSRQANFDGHYPYGDATAGRHLERPCKVGRYAPNAFGLHDMHGNVYEWCNDWYSVDIGPSPHVHPRGPRQGVGRVVRGGSWINVAVHCRSACPRAHSPAVGEDNLGFRVALGLTGT